MPVKKNKVYIYDKKNIDDWLSKGVEKEKTGRKPGRKLGVKQERMSNEDFDPWNLRKHTKNIEYSGEMVEIIRFLQPNLRHKEILV